VRSRGYVMPTAAREHLRRWISGQHVEWTPEAVALVNGDAIPASTVASRRRLLRIVALIVLPLVGAGVGFWVIAERDAAFAIPGAAGYSTFAGPAGEPLAIGRPWGRPCQPVRLTVEAHVPDWIYAQVVAVVNEARQDGIDVTVENREFFWNSNSLYYAPGQSPVSTERVPVFADDGTPPTLNNGQPEHIDLGWNASLDPDGHNENLTSAQGTLFLQAIDGNPQVVRRSIRQLIALTEGILSTTQPGSAIADGNSTDHFTAADIAAMQQMSGCNTYQAAP
jgi:hypothetical protein